MVGRSDDSSGRGFRRALREVERRESVHPADPGLVVVWEADARDAGSGVRFCHRAEVGPHLLSVVELEDGFLRHRPANHPKISWSVHSGEGWGRALVGGAAPSTEVAKARAEALWRALLGQKRS